MNAQPAPESHIRDTDKDGIVDERELRLKTLVQNADTDADGFADGFEDLLGEFGFHPNRPNTDSDGDGLSDAFERRLGSNPNDVDTDGDGWGDFDEYLNRHFGFDLLAPTTDADFDGLSADLEKSLGSSDDRVDSNSDGTDDFAAYNGGFPPVGIDLSGGAGELIGTTYSDAMREAIRKTRDGEAFSPEVLEELPYADVTVPPIRSGRVRPSAALMQRSAFNPANSPGIYPAYADVVSELFTIADRFDGSPGPNIVRLFVWSAPTEDCCLDERNRPGRRIYAMKISDNPAQNDNQPEILFMGMHHARELITVANTMALIKDLTDGYDAGDPTATALVNNNQIWVLAVVNPNGYDHVVAAGDDWRKNTRRVSPTQVRYGVDLNRNYGFEHASTLTVADRAALGWMDRSANGIASSGLFDENSSQYPAGSPFTEVETQAVRGLALSSFATPLGREEVGGLDCALSWHSYGGVVGHPMGHVPMPPNTGLTPADRVDFGALTNGAAGATGYTDIRDTFAQLRVSNGDPYDGYSVYGDTNDWLYKDRNTLAILIEAYSAAEGQSGWSFYPNSDVDRDAVAANNVKGAQRLIESCTRR